MPSRCCMMQPCATPSGCFMMQPCVMCSGYCMMQPCAMPSGGWQWMLLLLTGTALLPTAKPLLRPQTLCILVITVLDIECECRGSNTVFVSEPALACMLYQVACLRCHCEAYTAALHRKYGAARPNLPADSQHGGNSICT